MSWVGVKFLHEEGRAVAPFIWVRKRKMPKDVAGMTSYNDGYRSEGYWPNLGVRKKVLNCEPPKAGHGIYLPCKVVLKESKFNLKP